MPMVPPPPVPVVVAAPVHLIDRLIEVGSVGDGSATRGRRQTRRHAHKSEAQADQCCDEDCTHFSLLASSRGADRAPPMLWRLATACCGPRFGRRRRAFIRRSACRQIAPYRDDKRHWLKATPCSPNNAWLDHSSLVHCLAWH